MASKTTTILVNGEDLPGRGDISVHPGESSAQDWTQMGALFRLGEPSSTALNRNWAADVTMDEVFMWKGTSLETAQDLYARGRYYRPRFGYEAQFTSKELHGVAQVLRKMPEPSAALPPMAPADPNRKHGTRTQSVTPPTAGKTGPEVRVTTAFWTMYPERTDPKGKPLAYDALTEREIPVEIFMTFVVNDEETVWRLEEEGGSAVEDLPIGDKDKVRYRLRIRMTEANGSSILKGTPIIDDVTIFYSAGTSYLMYSQEDFSQ